MWHCDWCQQFFDDLMHGHHSEALRVVKDRIERNDDCGTCFRSYRETVLLCGQALRDRSPNSGDASSLLRVLREQLEEPS